MKHHLINRNCNHAALGMAHRRECPGFIGKLHDPTAMYVTSRIGMLGLHELAQGDS
ncbi:MAG: hypothetical protein ACK2T2_02410 [Anaerolineales bacterium]